MDTTILAQEIIVGNAAYPTDRIAKNSHEYRPLGLGYANLGALLMSQGMAYDSEDGRAWAAAITAIMCGQAYLTSARISADATGPCEGYAINEEPFLDVIRMHRDATLDIDSRRVPAALYENAKRCWEEAYVLGRVAGFRNAQTTVLAPTGTIGFMMDCDTTGIEPDLALVKYKKLVGGGMVKIQMDGHKNVTGVKIDPEAASDVEMLQDLIQAAINDALRKVDVIFICVPTPFDKMKAPDLQPVISATKSIAPRLHAVQLVILQMLMQAMVYLVVELLVLLH